MAPFYIHSHAFVCIYRAPLLHKILWKSHMKKYSRLSEAIHIWRKASRKENNISVCYYICAIVYAHMLLLDSITMCYRISSVRGRVESGCGIEEARQWGCHTSSNGFWQTPCREMGPLHHKLWLRVFLLCVCLFSLLFWNVGNSLKEATVFSFWFSWFPWHSMTPILVSCYLRVFFWSLRKWDSRSPYQWETNSQRPLGNTDKVSKIGVGSECARGFLRLWLTAAAWLPIIPEDFLLSWKQKHGRRTSP